MKKFVLIALLSSSVLVSFEWFNSSEGVQFKNVSFEEALEMAEAEEKYIFMDAYAEWCGPCKWMDKNTFKNAKVGRLFNKHFINLKIDMEKGEGPELARKYRVTQYPTMMIINSEGQVVKRIIGAKNETGLIEAVQNHLQP
ncbi:MAG: thioredoxin family protein [Bacteroidota bacterium]